MTTNRRLSMAEHIHELTAWHTHREPYEYDADHDNGSTTHYVSDHVTHQPPLIEQVWGTAGQRGQGGEVGAMTPSSKPAANLDAIDCAATIDIEAARWIRDLGEDDPQDTLGCIRRLHGLTASVHHCDRAAGRAGQDCCTYHAIEVSVRSWWVRARVLTGWDTAAVKLSGTCPLCGEKGTVKVRYSSGLGSCTNCHESWDAETIGILAEHMRAEAEADRFLPVVEPAQCAEVDDDGDVARIMLCPDCGSRRCVKAQDQTVGRLPDEAERGRRRAEGRHRKGA